MEKSAKTVSQMVDDSPALITNTGNLTVKAKKCCPKRF